MGQTIVVGGGIIGLWTALKRKQSGREVTIIDTYGVGNTLGSSSDRNRVIRSFYGGDDVYASMVAKSFADWEWLESISRESIFNNTKALWMIEDGNSPDYAKNSIPVSKKYGMNCYAISNEEANKLYPQINFQGVSNLYIEEKAGYINASSAAKELYKIFLSSGGSYLEGKVTNFNTTGNKISSVETSCKNRINCDELVLSCGPWLNDITQQILGYQVTSVTRQEVLYFSHPETGNHYTNKHLPVWINFGDKIHYGIPGSKSTGFKIADDSRGALFSPSDEDRQLSQATIESCRSLLKSRFPALKNAPLLCGKVCQYSNSVAGNYIIDLLPGHSNAIVVGAGNGHAFKNSPAIASEAIRLLDGETNPNEKFKINQINPKEKPGDQVTWARSKSV